jgi:hypothetical protein
VLKARAMLKGGRERLRLNRAARVTRTLRVTPQFPPSSSPHRVVQGSSRFAKTLPPDVSVPL